MKGEALVNATITVGRRKISAPRGTSLVEGLVSSLVLLTALVGVLQGVLISSRQNSMANRMTRAAAIAKQTLSGLQAQGRDRLLATGGALASATAVTSVTAQLTDGLENVQNTGGTLLATVVDVDVYDQSVTADLQVVSGYSAQDLENYERVIVYLTDSADASIDFVAIVVSWTEGGARRFVKAFGAMYDPAQNETFVEL